MELEDITRALTRRFWLLILGTSLAILGSYLVFRYATPWPRYEASATAIIGNADPDADWTSLQANREMVTTYVEWATRRPVLEGVIDALHLSISPEDLRGRIDAHAVGNTPMIEISVTHGGPQGAAVVANEVMRQLERQISAAWANEDDLLPSPSREEIIELQERINSTAAELSTLTDRLLETTSTEQADLLTLRINVLQSNLDMWRRQYAEARAEFASESSIRLVVVEEAQPPAQAANPLVNILVAGMAGLAATAGLTLLLEAQHPSGDVDVSFGWIARSFEGVKCRFASLLGGIKCRFDSLREDMRHKPVTASAGGDFDET